MYRSLEKQAPQGGVGRNSPRELSRLGRGVVLLLAAVVLVALLELLGLTRVVDRGLQRTYFTLSEHFDLGRRTTEKVVLLTDGEAISASWGPPPWPDDRLVELVVAVSAGQPTAIVAVGHEPMFAIGAGERLLAELDALEHRPGQPSPAEQARLQDLRVVRDAVEQNRLVLPEAGDSAWTAGGLVPGDLALTEDMRLTKLIERMAWTLPSRDRLPVHWLLPADRLPTLPIERVMGGDISTSNFHGQVVLFGLSAPEHVLMIDTPAGPLSTAQVEAHALAGVADGVVWQTAPRGWSWAFATALGGLMLWILHRSSGRVGLLAVGLLGTILLVVDFWLFNEGILRSGGARPALLLIGVTLTYWIGQARDTVAGLERLHAKVVRAAGADKSESEAEEAGFWDDLAELGRVYAEQVVADGAACSICERPAGRFTALVQASAGLDGDGHEALRARGELELRRAPLRSTWLTRRPSWTKALLPRGQSLIVPLQVEGDLLGVWLVHIDEATTLERERVEALETLGRQMAVAILRRRERALLREQAARPRLRDRVETIFGGLRMLRNEQRWALELLEQLPVRALISTVWGEIEYVDPRLRQVLARRYPGLFTDDSPSDMRAVLARLIGKPLDEAHRLMRKVVREGVELELDAVRGNDDEGDDVWVLTRVESRRGIDLPGFKPALHEHIVLMARSSIPARRVQTQSGGWLRVLGGSVGER